MMVDRKQWELETRVEPFCCQIYHAPAVPAMSSHQGRKSQKNATRCLSLDTKQHLAIPPAKYKSHGGDNHQEEASQFHEGRALRWRCQASPRKCRVLGDHEWLSGFREGDPGLDSPAHPSRRHAISLCRHTQHSSLPVSFLICA